MKSIFQKCPDITQNTNSTVIFSVIPRTSSKYVEARTHFKETHSLLEVGLFKNSLAEVGISADSASKALANLLAIDSPKEQAYSLGGISGLGFWFFT